MLTLIISSGSLAVGMSVVGVAAGGLQAFNTLQTNVISIISTLALIWAAWQILQNLIKKKWAELIGFLVVAGGALYLLGGITKLKTLGDWLMSTFFGL